jgi:ArsR family transcriptional regulator
MEMLKLKENLPSSMLAKAEVLKALGDETRLRIIGLLTHSELCVCDIMAVLDIPQSTVSRHLAYLKNTGWIDGNRKGVWRYYALTEDAAELKQGVLKILIKSFKNDAMAKRDQLALEIFLREKTRECR